MRGRLREQRRAAEERYERYAGALRQMLYQAEAQAREGSWSEVANMFQAITAHASSMAGVARELSLIYLLWTED